MKKIIALLFVLFSAIAVFAQLMPADSLSVGSGGVGHFSTTPLSTIKSVELMLLGFFFYFTMRFRLKKISDATSFRLGTWLDHNWSNVVLYLIGIVLMFVYGVKLTPGVALMIGSAPNLFFDWVQKEFSGK